MPLVSMETTPSIPVYTILDTLNAISGVDVNTSHVSGSPSAVQIEPTPAATTVEVQARLSPTSSWVTIQLVAAATATATIVPFSVRYNFIRAIRVGAGDVVVMAQD